MFKVGDIYTGVRALLNDQENATFTDAVQLEYFKLAYTTLRTRCEEYDIPFVLKTSDIAIQIPQGVKDIGGSTGPALPADFIEPLACWEIPSGTSNDYMLMRRLQFLPKTDILTAYLEVYQWAGNYIHFLGATGDIQVKLDYICDPFGNKGDSNDIIRLENSLNFLKFHTAALVSQFSGENPDRAAALADLGQDTLDTMLNIEIKNAQNISTRRRPFMASYKLRAGTFGR